jgi:imidazolonepropionase-like amidohydrolase
MSMKTISRIAVAGLLVAGPASAAADRPLLLKNGNIVTVAGADIPGGDILVRDGKIAAVGKGLAEPGAEVVDLAGRWIMPGIIDSHSHIALEGDVNETGDLITSEVDVRDVINPQDMNIYYALTGGVTSVLTMHGSANPIAARGVVLKLRWGGSAADLVFEGAPLVSKWALGENPKGSNMSGVGKPRYPKSRMGVEASIRLEFEKAKQYRREGQAYERSLDAFRARKAKGPAPLPPRRDLRLEGILEILDGKLWVHCHAYQSEEMVSIMRLCKEYGVKLASFEHALEGYRLAEELARDGVGISVFADFWAYKWEAYNTMPHNAALSVKKGATVALNSDDAERMRHLFNDAAKTMRFGGLSEAEALRTLTLNPAKMLGIDKKVGTIEPGKDADLAVFNRHPLDPYTVCQMTLVDGKVLFDRDRYLEERAKAEEAAKAKAAPAPKGMTAGAEE